MTLDDYTDVDSVDLEAWHWYALIGYPVVSLLGIVSLGQLTGGGSVLATGIGSIALLIALTAFAVVSLPALWRDAEFARAASDDWTPNREIYVGGAAGAPLLLGALGGLAGGFGVAVALTVFAFLVSTVVACVAYLYNRHREIGLTSR